MFKKMNSKLVFSWGGETTRATQGFTFVPEADTPPLLSLIEKPGVPLRQQLVLSLL